MRVPEAPKPTFVDFVNLALISVFLWPAILCNKLVARAMEGPVESLFVLYVWVDGDIDTLEPIRTYAAVFGGALTLTISTIVNVALCLKIHGAF